MSPLSTLSNSCCSLGAWLQGPPAPGCLPLCSKQLACAHFSRQKSEVLFLIIVEFTFNNRYCIVFQHTGLVFLISSGTLWHTTGLLGFKHSPSEISQGGHYGNLSGRAWDWPSFPDPASQQFWGRLNLRV